MTKIKSSEITPEQIYLSRRRFMVGIGALAASSLALAACGVQSTSTGQEIDEDSLQVSADTDELGDSLNTFEEVTNFNNFYEFTTDKQKVAALAQDFQTSPWTVEVGGLVNKPGTYDIDDLRRKFTQEERIYRLRCVEGWSMVIPWLGFPLAQLLKEVEPTSNAKYVRFETIYDPDQLPGQQSAWYNWPYVEGLRLDEAMNELAILSHQVDCED